LTGEDPLKRVSEYCDFQITREVAPSIRDSIARSSWLAVPGVSGSGERTETRKSAVRKRSIVVMEFQTWSMASALR